MHRSAPHTAADRQGETILLYGHHAVAAALANPERPCHRLFVTENAARHLGGVVGSRPGLSVERVHAREIDRRLGTDAVHQGCCLEAAPLPHRELHRVVPELPAQALVLMLDQVEDPRNVGAVLRSAAAFGADLIVLPRHGGALLNGACAKAASGALDMLPIVTVASLVQALQLLKQHGFWALGLDGSAQRELAAVPSFERRVLVLGAESKGLRRLTREACDLTARLAIDPRIDSLNVAVAAGIALFMVRSGTRGSEAESPAAMGRPGLPGPARDDQ